MKKDWREKVGNFLSNEFVEVEVKPYKEGEKNDYFSVNKNGSFEENSDPANASAYQEETPAGTGTAEDREYEGYGSAEDKEFEKSGTADSKVYESYGYADNRVHEFNGTADNKVHEFYGSADLRQDEIGRSEVDEPKYTDKIPITHRMAAKVIAFILVIVMAAVFTGSVLGAILMYDYGLYQTSEESFKEDIISGMVYNDGFNMTWHAGNNDLVWLEDFCNDRNIAQVKIADNNSGETIWTFEKDTRKPADKIYTNTYEHDRYIDEYGKEMAVASYDVSITLSDNFVIQDEYYIVDSLLGLLYAMRFWIYPLGVGSFILAIASFIFLMCSSGRRVGHRDPQPGWGTAIPFDITTVAVIGPFVLMGLSLDLMYSSSAAIQLITICGAVLVTAVMFLGWCMSFAVRIKLGGWWKNTVTVFLLILLWKILKACGRGFIRVCRAIGRFVGMIPMIWRTCLIMAAVTFIEIFVLLCCMWEYDNLVVCWIIGKFIQIPLVLWLAVTLRKLQKGGNALAEGDLGYNINTKRMIWDFKRHGENLNSIGAGMNRAVEQRLKSERMKTELITNVSHDIKTPLTSIINYSDLICKEETDNEKIHEYADVLHRQSERLKRLIEDLVEASKASTGNLEVNLVPCEVGVMLTQTVGEYQQKIRNANLELITSQPDEPVVIMADGRRLWRVVDNLMNNLCKYSMPGTRVYLTLEKRNDEAVISFKNISKAPLNITADELLERFVRGDASRNTEGNGLGLSIAKSLTELQKGKMEITTDGDLFKVILRFPTIK